MTYETLEATVVANLNNRNDATTLTSIKARTNFLIEWLATQQEWEDLQTSVEVELTADDYEYSLSDLTITNLDRLYSVQLYDGSRWLDPMEEVTRITWNRSCLPYVSSATGKPSKFNRFGGNFYFARTPDDDYLIKIDYYAKPTKVTGSASVIPFNNMDGLFEAMVTGLTWLSIGESKLADQWLKIAMPMIDSFGLDSRRLLNSANPNRKTKVTPDPWLDPFSKR